MTHAARSLITLATSLALLTACEDSYVTSGDQIRLQAPDLRVGVHQPFDNSTTVLEGTRVCSTCEATVVSDTGGGTHPLLSCGDGYSNSDILTCFSQDLFRGHFDDDGCVVLDGPEQTAWLLQPETCTVSDFWDFTPEADSLVYKLTAREDVYATFEQWPEDIAFALYEHGDLRQSGGGGFPAELKNPVFEPFRVLADQEFTFAPQLIDEVRDAAVAFNAGESRIEVLQLGGPEAIVEDGVTPATVTIRPKAGSRVGVFLVVQNTEVFKVGEVLGVAASTLNSMELVVAMEDTQATDSWGPPVAARAVVRDAAGHLVYGVPVEWKVTRGTLSVGGGEIQYPGADYITLGDTCYKPDELTVARTATLSASYEDLDAETELLWTPYIDDEYSLNVQNCQTACGGCASGPMAPGVGGLFTLVLGALAGVRRRKRD